MSIRFKAVATALGLVIAAGSVGTASADMVVKRTTRHVGVTKTVKIIHQAHRRLVGTRIVRQIRLVPRGPVLVRPALVRVVAPRPHLAVIHPYGVRAYGERIVTTKKIVRITRGPLQTHAMFHRAGGAKIIIR